MRSLRPLMFAVSLFALLAVAGCAQQRFEKLFAESVARPALACLHPAGDFRSAGGVKAEGNDTFTGLITWRGRALDNEYVTRVRVTVASGQARVEVMEDSALVPAVRPSCEIPVPQ